MVSEVSGQVGLTREEDAPDAGNSNHGLVKVRLLVNAVGSVKHGLYITQSRLGLVR